MRKWRCLFAPFDARLALPRARLSRRPAERKDRAQYHLDSHADFPSLPPKLETEWRDYWTFFAAFSSKLRPSSPQSVTRTFLLWRKSAFRYVPLPAPSLHRSHLRTREHDSALPRSPVVFFCLSSRRARAPRIPSESVAFESPRRTDGRTVRVAAGSR